MVGESPLLVIDGFQHGTDFLGTHEIPRKSIYVLSFLSKETAPNIFGNSGKEGVILITSKFGRLSAVLSTRDSKALYIVNGVDTPPPTVKNIPREQMESIEVIEGNEIARKKYSSEYEVVFIIKLKKP